MCKRPLLPALFMERQSPRFPGCPGSSGELVGAGGAGGQPPSCRNLGACRNLPARGWQMYQLTGKREREGGHPRLRVTPDIPAGADRSARRAPAGRAETNQPCEGRTAEEGPRAGAPVTAQDNAMPWAWPADRGPQSDLGASPLSAGNQPAVLAAALGWSSAAGLSHRLLLSLVLRVHLVLIQVASGSPQR